MKEERRINEELKEELARLHKQVRDLELERGKIQETLKDAEERQRLIYENSPMGMGFVNLEGVLVDCNDALAAIIGTPRDRLMGFPMKTELTNEAVAVALARAFSGKIGAFEGDYTAVTSGKTTTLRAIFSPLFNRSGKLKGVLFLAEDITERRGMEESLRQSESRYKAIVENQAEFVVRYLSGGIVSFVNDTLCRYLGLNPEDVLGRSYYPFIHPEDRQGFVAQIEALGRNEPSRVAEARVVLPDGRVTWHRWTHVAIFDSAGKLVEYQATGRDVSDRKAAEDELRQSEEKYRDLIETTNTGFVILDGQGRVLDANDEYVRMTGHSAQKEILGKNVIGWTAPYDRERSAAEVKKCMERGSVRNLEIDYATADGRIIPVEISATVVGSGGETRIVSLCRDITARRQAEAALREEQTRYRTLFDNLDAAVLLMRGAVCVECNPATLTLFGLDEKSEILGKTPLDFAPPKQPDGRDSAELVQRNVEQALAKGLHIFEWQAFRKDGQPVHMEVRFTPYRIGGEQYFQCIAIDITERKRAEAVLRENEDRYRQLYEAESDAIFLIENESGRILMANTAAAVMYGYSAEELLHLKNTDLSAEPSETRRVTEETPIMRENTVSIPLRYHRKKDGTVFPVEITGRFFNYQDRPVHIAAIRDITERKRAEEALRASEGMLRQSQRVARVGHYVYHVPAGAWTSSEMLDEIFGIGPDYRRTVETWLELVHPAQRTELFEYLRDHVLRDRKPFNKEYRILRHADQVPVWVHGLGTLEVDTDGNPVRMFGTIQDISERKRSEEALRSSETRFRSIIEHAASGVLVADAATGRFLYANPECCRMFGYESGEFLALDVSAIHPGPERERARRAFAARQGIQTECLRKDGSVFPVDIKPVGIELDGRSCLVGFFTDITERKLLEEERLKTEKLESIGTLAGGIAHDFNNLLQGMFGYLSIAKRTADRQRSLAMLDQAEKALHLAVNLTTQLLTFSKGGAPVKKRLALRPVIENAVKFALSGSPVTPRLMIDGGLSAADADEGQISQVIQNIVLNADQAMPMGGTIEIEAKNAGSHGLALPQGPAGYVTIAIRDSGTGIPENMLSRIFDPYFTTKEKGSGLGLATSYSIVKNHGGSIAVRSEAGKGSEFTIYLPAADEGETEEQSRPASPAAGRRGKFLVMDDEEIVRQVAGEMIRSLGHAVDVIADGAAALAKFKQARDAGAPYDAVILDLTVRGGMGGLETIRRLREIAPDVKAAVSSGYSDDGVLSEHRTYGFRFFLRKPYDQDELARVLNALLQ